MSINHNSQTRKQQELTSSISDYQRKISEKLETTDLREEALTHLRIAVADSKANPIRHVDVSSSGLIDCEMWNLPKVVSMSFTNCSSLRTFFDVRLPELRELQLGNR